MTEVEALLAYLDDDITMDWTAPCLISIQEWKAALAQANITFESLLPRHVLQRHVSFLVRTNCNYLAKTAVEGILNAFLAERLRTGVFRAEATILVDRGPDSHWWRYYRVDVYDYVMHREHA